MAGTSTDPAAVGELSSALGAWASSATGIATQAGAVANAFVDEVEKEVRVRSARVGALEAALRVAQKEERARLAQKLRLAQTSLEHARRSLGIATGAAREAQVLQRRIAESTASRVPSAAKALGRKLDALSDYAGAPIPDSGGGSGAGRGGLDFGVPGIVDVPLEQASFEDNPIRDGFRRGGADLSDYRWAVETWETVVRPGVLVGKTREDFHQRDAEQGRHMGFRRTAGVYDMFLGSDPVSYSRRPDGTLEVSSGRHRVEVARRLGITHLPGKIHG